MVASVRLSVRPSVSQRSHACLSKVKRFRNESVDGRTDDQTGGRTPPKVLSLLSHLSLNLRAQTQLKLKAYMGFKASFPAQSHCQQL